MAPVLKTTGWGRPKHWREKPKEAEISVQERPCHPYIVIDRIPVFSRLTNVVWCAVLVYLIFFPSFLLKVQVLDVLKARIEEDPELDRGRHRNFQNIHVCAAELWLGLLGPLHWNMEAWGSVGRLVRTSHVWERNTAASSVPKHPPAALLVSSLLWSHGRLQQELPWDETGEARQIDLDFRLKGFM